MKRTIIAICVAAVFVPEIVLAGNCGSGQGAAVGNPHCGQAPRVPSTNQAGVQPSQNTNPPTQVGGVIPDHHNTVLVPPQPVAQQTPPPVAVVAPPQALPPQKTPMLVPPQPVAQQTPPQAVVVAPPQALPPQKTPMLVPPQPVAQQTPPQVPTAIPQSVTTPSALAGSGAAHGNALLVHAPDIPKPLTSGRIAETSAYTLEFIEPGLQSRKVKVYRSNDAAEQVYKDTIPLDQGGFQIIVVGTRNPDYIH